MLNKYPLWKYLLVTIVCALGVIYSLPNLYPPDAAVQITPAKSGDAVDEYTLKKALSALEEGGIKHFGEELQEGKTALIRLESQDLQLQAKGLIQRELGDGFIVALNLAPTTPQWLMDLGAGPMTLGLDLSGGVHFLMEVDMEEFIGQRVEGYRDTLKRNFREEKLRYKRVVAADENKIKVMFAKEDVRDEAENYIRREYPEFLTETENKDDGFWIELELPLPKSKSLKITH